MDARETILADPDGMNPETPAAAASTVRTDEVVLRTLRERRRRVWRGMLMIIIVTVAMVVVSIMNRDEVAIRSCRQRMRDASRAFQERYAKGLQAPPLLPLPSDPGPDGQAQARVLSLREHVYYNVLHEGRRDSVKEIGVCCCRWPHTRLIGRSGGSWTIGASGRHVIVFNSKRKQYEVRWMDEAEFQRQADRLGLRDPTAP